MTLTGMVDARRAAAVLLALALASGMFVGNQRHAEAATLAQQIICYTDQQLGPDIPFNPHTDYCDDDNGGGNGGGGGGGNGGGEDPTPQEQCATDHGFWDGDSCEPVPTCNTEAGEVYNAETNQCVPPTPPTDPVDVCPNWEDVQTEVPAGFHHDEQGNCVEDGASGGDGSSGEEDPGIEGSNGGHHRGGGGNERQYPAAVVASGMVLGLEDCSQFLTDFLRIGAHNDTEQVTRLQNFFNEFEGMNVAVSGVFDDATLKAVHTFQTKYASDILTPWGANESTGYVFYTTQKKVNELYCKGTKQFPLTDSAEQYISKVRAGQNVPAPTHSTPKVTSKVDLSAATANSDTKTNDSDDSDDSTSETPEPKQSRGFWGSMGDFFSKALRFGR